MASRAIVAATLLASGCNAIFGLDPTRLAPADAGDAIDGVGGCPGSTHDEDHDGIADACDLCPSTADDQTDTDGDGVGDACDPNASMPGDRILYFDAFDTTDAGHWTGVRGTWQIADDSLVQSDAELASGLAIADYDLSAQTSYTIEIVVATTAWSSGDPGSPRGIGVWYAASGGSLAAEPDGYLCEAYSYADLSTATASLWAKIGPVTTPLDSQDFPQVWPVDTDGRVRASHLPGFELCTQALGADAVATLTSGDATFASGLVELRTLSASAAFHSVTVYGVVP